MTDRRQAGGGGRAGRHRRRLGPHVRDGAGRDRAAADDGLPRLPLPARRRCSWRWSSAGSCATCRAAGWRAGALMGVFLTAGYIFQTLGLEHTTRVERRLHHRPVRGAHAAARRDLPARAAAAVGLGGGRRCPRVGPVPALGRGRRPRAARRRPGAAVRGRLRRRTSSSPPAAVRDHDVGALLVVQLGVCGVGLPGHRGGGRATSRCREGATVWSALIVTSLVASALGSSSRPTPSSTRRPAHGPDPGQRARLRRPVRLPAGRRAPVARSPGSAPR